MSATKTVRIPDDTRETLSEISNLLSNLNVGNADGHYWLASNDGNSSYDWGQVDLGVDTEGNLLVCEQSGCSCYGPEAPSADKVLPLGEAIELEDDYYEYMKPAVEELSRVAETLRRVLVTDDATAEEIIALPNAEVRRAAVEKVGYERVTAKADMLDESEDGRLLRIPLDNDEDIVLVHVKDPSTTREYFLRVPPTMKTARQARAWTFGFEADDFKPVREA